MVGKHYLRVKFSFEPDKSPKIYNFFFDHLSKILSELRLKEVKLDIERLEPLDAIYTNLKIDDKEIKKVFDKFAKCHHLKEVPSILVSRRKTSLKSKVKTKDLSSILKDYNVLFDIFFTDIVIEADKKLRLEMMDAFSNSLLVSGPVEFLGSFKKAVKKRMRSVKFVNVDHKTGKKVGK